MRHRSDAVIVAVLFLACKEQNLPRTFRDLAYPLSIDEGEIKKAHKQVGEAVILIIIICFCFWISMIIVCSPTVTHYL